MTTDADQLAPSTGQPGVDKETLTAIAWERDEALKRADARFASMERHATFLACESADRLAWRLAYRYCEDVPALRQQLAAAQAERDEEHRKRMTLIDLSNLECGRLVKERDQLRAQIEDLRQRVMDYATAEGTAIAQRNAALNEALAYKFQVEAMRGALRKHAVFQVRALQTHCAECSATWTGSRDGAAEQHKPGCLAALDAASAGQSQEQVQVPEALVAFRSRFRGSADLSTFTQFGFFEAGYVAGRHAEHVRTGRWETDCPACGARRVNATG